MMFLYQGISLTLLKSLKRGFAASFLLITFFFNPLHGASRTEPKTITYYLYITDFADSFIQIPTSNVSGESSTTASSYLAGRASIYNVNNEKVGTCSASFLSMQNADGIYTDISNYLSVDSGLIVSWFTPTKLINLELDSIINSMVTECIVKATTKILLNPFYGQTFNLVVSSDDQKIYFEFSRIGAIF
ncbi:MAG: hypothetical protein JSS09_00250 [Verrucomicrobia bacterium]|nr:hypothetical protein [Verrucomicrobiota bacterium]